MAVGDAYVFPGFLTPVLTQLFFPKPPTFFLTCFCRGERRKYARKKSRLNRGSNSQLLGYESDALNTEPPGRGSNNVHIGRGVNLIISPRKDFSRPGCRTSDLPFSSPVLPQISDRSFQSEQ